MYKLLIAQIRVSGRVKISVVGASMNPILFDGDQITVSPCEYYFPGDILVYNYKQEGLLVHRLLYVKENKYFCKGDNSFRLEDISKEQIVGKIILVNEKEPPPCTERILKISYLVNREFLKCRYNIEKTKQSDIYQLYKKVVLHAENDVIIYKKNETTHYIHSNDTSLTVFNPNVSNANLFDKISTNILNLLSEPRDLDSLLEKLCVIYNVTKDEIRTFVEDFLADAISKKIVEKI